MQFHHIGVACSNIDVELKKFSALGYNTVSETFADEIQGVSGVFIDGGGPKLELLVQTGENKVLTPWLKLSSKLYHLAYTTENIENDITKLKSQGSKLLVKPVQAKAFGGAKIAFLIMPNMLLIELIETL